MCVLFLGLLVSRSVCRYLTPLVIDDLPGCDRLMVVLKVEDSSAGRYAEGPSGYAVRVRRVRRIADEGYSFANVGSRAGELLQCAIYCFLEGKMHP